MVTPAENPSTSPSARSRRDTQILTPLPNTAPPSEQEAQLPQLPSPPLSFSEPTLRFPRPQGNQILAHWISKSDTGSMHFTSVPIEDNGLSESTYELIGGTDSESQDGNYTDNISESVASLDFHRPDDVVSLAGTEHTCDEESVGDAADDHGEYPSTKQPSLDMEGHINDADFHDDVGDDDDDDDDDGNSSRASIEFTDHSLHTPSILTPEASRYMMLPTNASQRDKLYSWLSNHHEAGYGSIGSIVRSCLVALPGLLLLVGLVFLAPAIFFLVQQQSQPTMSKAVSSIFQATTLEQAMQSHGTSTATLGSLTSPTSGVALIPMPASRDDGLFRSRKPTISFTPHGKNDVLIHVGRDVRDIWLTRNCLNVTVMRSSQKLDFTLSSAHDGIVVKFPRREAYGIVSLSVQSSCRPRTEKAVKVHFGKGVIVDAFEKTKSLAQDLSDLVPVAAHEAERFLAGAKKVLGSASESLAHAWLHGTEKAQDFMINTKLRDGDWLVWTGSEFWKQALGAFDEWLTISSVYPAYMNTLRSAQTKLQLGILDAQISARLWWLRIQGKDDERQAYASKARIYLEDKVLAAEKFLRGIRGGKPEAKIRA